MYIAKEQMRQIQKGVPVKRNGSRPHRPLERWRKNSRRKLPNAMQIRQQKKIGKINEICSNKK